MQNISWSNVFGKFLLIVQVKFKLLTGKFTWCNKVKHCWVMSTHSKLFCPWFEFSLKVKVMGSNLCYILKSLPNWRIVWIENYTMIKMIMLFQNKFQPIVMCTVLIAVIFAIICHLSTCSRSCSFLSASSHFFFLAKTGNFLEEIGGPSLGFFELKMCYLGIRWQ